MQNFNRFLILISALSLSSTAAYFSVFGLSRLFAGAGISIIIMASVLEISKIFTAYTLHNSYSVFPRLIKIYLSTAIIILMLITSAGIYGFLSSAYKETATNNDIVSREVSIIDAQIDNLKDRLTLNQEELKSNNTDVSQLRQGLSSGTNVSYVDKSGNVINTTSSSARKVFESQLEKSLNRRDILFNEVEKYSNKIDSLEIVKLNLSLENDAASELGPLIYLSELTGYSMDSIINYFILSIILVFDPLAIVLVISLGFFNTKPSQDSEDKPDSIILTPKLEEIVEDLNDPVNDTVNDTITEDIKEEIPDNTIKGYIVEVQEEVEPVEKIVDNGQKVKTTKVKSKVVSTPVIDDSIINSGNYSILAPEDYENMTDDQLRDWYYKNKNKK